MTHHAPDPSCASVPAIFWQALQTSFAPNKLKLSPNNLLVTFDVTFDLLVVWLSELSLGLLFSSTDKEALIGIYLAKIFASSF